MTITEVPTAITEAPVDATYTQVPEGVAMVTLSDIITAAGSGMKWWFEVGVSPEEIEVGGGGFPFFTQINDMGPDAVHVAQAVFAAKPLKNVGGGPLGKNSCDLDTSIKRLVNTTVNLTAGRDMYYVMVFKLVGTGPFRVCANLRTADGEAAGSAALYMSTDGTHFEVGAKRNGAAADDAVVTSPAFNTNWNKLTLQLSAAAAPVCQINGTNISPALSASVGASDAIQTIVIGHASVAIGSIYLFGGFDAPSAGLKASIDTYVNQQTGL